MAAGIPEDSGPDSAQSSSCPGNTSSSSSPPPPPPRSFLLRPPPAGLLGPAPSAPRVRPARGPLLSGAPTQAHGSMKQEEEAERERSRLPRLRLGQEKRWETRSAPRPLPPPRRAALSRSATVPSGPPHSAATGGAGERAPRVRGEGPGAAWGGGSRAAGEGGGRLGLRAACAHRGSYVKMSHGSKMIYFSQRCPFQEKHRGICGRNGPQPYLPLFWLMREAWPSHSIPQKI